MILFAIGMPGPMELTILLVIVLVIFGAGRLPTVLGQLGQGLRAFRDGQKSPDNAEPKPLPKVTDTQEVSEKTHQDAG